MSFFFFFFLSLNAKQINPPLSAESFPLVVENLINIVQLEIILPPIAANHCSTATRKRRRGCLEKLWPLRARAASHSAPLTIMCISPVKPCAGSASRRRTSGRGAVRRGRPEAPGEGRAEQHRVLTLEVKPPPYRSPRGARPLRRAGEPLTAPRGRAARPWSLLLLLLLLRPGSPGGAGGPRLPPRPRSARCFLGRGVWKGRGGCPRSRGGTAAG